MVRKRINLLYNVCFSASILNHAGLILFRVKYSQASVKCIVNYVRGFYPLLFLFHAFRQLELRRSNRFRENSAGHEVAIFVFLPLGHYCERGFHPACIVKTAGAAGG